MNVPCIGYGIRYEYGIFRQTFVDGEQVEQPDSWLALGNPWEIAHPEAAVQVNFGGTPRPTDEAGVERTRWVPDWNVLGVPYNYMVPGYLNGRVNTLRLWSAQATQAFDLQHLQRRRLRPGGARPDLRREHLQGALPRGLHPAGQGAAAAAAVLLRGLFAARLHRRPGPRLRPARPARAGDLPAQRHPPGDRGARADAHPDRRARLRLGRGLGDHLEVLRLHLSHPAARGAGGVVGRPARTAAAAPPGDHLPDQRGVPRPGPRDLAGRLPAAGPDVDHRRVPRARRPDGLPGHGGRHQGQRRRRAALAAAARQGAERLRRAVAGQVHQRHQRRHAAPVHEAGQPAPVRPDHRRDRLGLGHRPGAAAGTGAAGRRSRLPRGVRRGEAGQQDPAARPAAGP